MSSAAVRQEQPRGSWAGAIALAIVHLIAFAMLYLVVVQMNWAFRDFFNLLGTKPTSRFESASRVADLTAAYTPVVLMMLAVHLAIVFRLYRRTNGWVSAYSHGMLLCMGLAGFVCVSCAVHAMAWGTPGIAHPPNAATVVTGSGGPIAADVNASLQR